jgi:hypothetical protein
MVVPIRRAEKTRRFVELVSREFMGSPFAQTVCNGYGDPQSRQDQLVDVQITLNDLPVLSSHKVVLGFAFPFFHEFFYALDENPDGLMTIPLDRFPFPEVVLVLLKFCTLMDCWSFELDNSLRNVGFGYIRSQVVLFSVLSYLGEIPLCSRVRLSLSREPGTEDDSIRDLYGCYSRTDQDSSDVISGASRAVRGLDQLQAS